LGRCDDGAVIGGQFLAYGSFQGIVERYAAYGSTPQLELWQANHRDRLLIKLEAASTGVATASDGDLAALRATILAEIPDLAEALASGLLGQLEIQCLAPGGLIRLERTGKIVHVIDRRRRTGQLG
ncbi:MAG: hypothetical protein KGR26_01380, partial [Cyanobacteria bacterium REEB65]|nr:hypothetical protein [Cyanobacteria bacterium REEB65]